MNAVSDEDKPAMGYSFIVSLDEEWSAFRNLVF